MTSAPVEWLNDCDKAISPGLSFPQSKMGPVISIKDSSACDWASGGEGNEASGKGYCHSEAESGRVRKEGPRREPLWPPAAPAPDMDAETRTHQWWAGGPYAPLLGSPPKDLP